MKVSSFLKFNGGCVSSVCGPGFEVSVYVCVWGVLDVLYFLQKKPYECSECGPDPPLCDPHTSAGNVGRPSAAAPPSVTVKGCTVTAAPPLWQGREDKWADVCQGPGVSAGK